VAAIAAVTVVRDPIAARAMAVVKAAVVKAAVVKAVAATVDACVIGILSARRPALRPTRS